MRSAAFLTVLLSGAVHAQVLTDNGAAIAVQGGAQLTVKGAVLATSGSTFINAGTIDLNGNLTNNSGSGLFTATLGNVIMNGTAQSIGGTSVTAFDDLDLQCTTLTLQQDVITGGLYPAPSGVLNVGNAIVQLNTQRITVNNAASTAITRNTGQLVSESLPVAGYGEVQWNIGTSTGAYVVPFGTGTAYLPVTLTVTGAGTGPGSFVFATYPTDPFASPNNRPLPTGLSVLTTMNGTENAPNVLDRFWPITTAAYSTAPSATLLFTYRDSEWNTGTNAIGESGLKAQHFSGSTWSYPPMGTVNTVANTVTTSLTNTYDQVWALVENSEPLPVELLSFDAVAEGTVVQCAWSTASETNNDFFTVERSADGTSFTEVGEVDGAGNSQQRIDYAFTDPAPLGGLSYYRLRQTDFDGTEVRSASVAVWFGQDAGELLVFPNPCTTELRLPGGSEAQHVKVLDATGRLVLDRTGAAPASGLDVSALPSGAYTLMLEGDVDVRTARFIKQ